MYSLYVSTISNSYNWVAIYIMYIYVVAECVLNPWIAFFYACVDVNVKVQTPAILGWINRENHNQCTLVGSGGMLLRKFLSVQKVIWGHFQLDMHSILPYMLQCINVCIFHKLVCSRETKLRVPRMLISGVHTALLQVTKIKLPKVWASLKYTQEISTCTVYNVHIH